MLPLTRDQKALASNIADAIDRDAAIQVLTSSGVSVSQQEDRIDSIDAAAMS